MTTARRWTRGVVVGLVVVFCTVAVGAGSKSAAKPRRAAAIMPLPAAVTKDPPRHVMDVARVKRGTRPAVQAAAGRIDELLAKHRQEHGVEPSRHLTDAAFARRIYLELAGRIPTHDELVAFLDSKDGDKRADLVDALLESPDYVSHFYNFWADILRLQERPDKHLVFEPYLAYVKDSIRTNKPYDEWVHEMLTADGRLWENPAVGFQLRDEGMPLPYVDNTVRVLLGTQIGCAQCHDHPFDHWTQHEFYELAALTAGTKTRPGGDGPGKKRTPPSGPAAQIARAAYKLQQENKERGQKNRAAVSQFLRANVTSVAFADKKLTLPHDYQYDDAKPLETVSPKVLWGEVPSAARAANGREQFASWIVSRDNRQFARTIANRLWKKVMGVGLVEPVDDFKDDNPATDPELLEHLTDEMLRLDFDLREFVRILVSTDTFSRRAVLHDTMSAAPFRFPGPALKRMTAEQLWDSILTLVARNQWAAQRPTVAEVAGVMTVDLRTATLDDVDRGLEAFLSHYGRQASKRHLMQACGYRGLELVRASELPTPLPLGHFLRQFGQSDRETIEGGRTVATIPQILAMFNGPITHAMLEKGSVIYDEVTSHKPKEAVDVVFLSVLSHRPTAEERAAAIQEITSAEDPATGCGNVIWALLNTREFLFIQ
ncbi:MAG: DUF1553 domain-containing protein [Planctomycetia bacterium]|nr:DUF1553 domain-containing protein [Planctomycetia bacterium]